VTATPRAAADVVGAATGATYGDELVGAATGAGVLVDVVSLSLHEPTIARNATTPMAQPFFDTGMPPPGQRTARAWMETEQRRPQPRCRGRFRPVRRR
jgi:hypothetical protein